MPLNMDLGRCEDLTGRVFGRLTVARFAGKNKHTTMWDCRCECGNDVFAKSAINLKSGSTSSCGCLRRELKAAEVKTHGRTNTPEWRAWVAMRSRCSDVNTPSWSRYGGRGIYVCDEWLRSFEAFFADMGERPSKYHSIERRDNDGPYDPKNCYWATDTEQANNRSSTRRITFEGVTKSVMQWCRELGVGYTTVLYRLKEGQSIEQAFRPGRTKHQSLSS